MDYIRFKENFNNKLDNGVFTTIRPDDPIRYQVGLRYNIICDGVETFEARIARIINYYELDDIPMRNVKLDTGLDNLEDFKSLMEQFYGKDKKGWVVLVLQRV